MFLGVECQVSGVGYWCSCFGIGGFKDYRSCACLRRRCLRACRTEFPPLPPPWDKNKSPRTQDQNLGFRVWSLGFRAEGLWIKVQGQGFRV